MHLPRVLQENPGAFDLSGDLMIWHRISDERCLNALQQIAERFREAGRVKVKLRETVNLPENTVSLRSSVEEPGVAVPASGQLQGYSLRIQPDRMVLRGDDEAGLFYGLCALAQLLCNYGLRFSCMLIADWPDMKYRGFSAFFGGHCYDHDAENIRRYQRLASEIIRLRGNLLCFESEAFVNDQNLRQFGQFCRENFLELIPLHPFLCWNQRNVVQFVKADNKSFAEMLRPAERALRLLQPSFFAIAADELFSSYDHTRRNSIYTEEQLQEHAAREWLLLALLRFHRYFKQRGVRMAIWADMLLDPEAFWGSGCEMKDFTGGEPDCHAGIIDQLPRDILLWDWQYVMNPSYPTLDYLLSKGFEVISCPLLDGSSVYSLPRYVSRMSEPRPAGLMHLTWTPTLPEGTATTELEKCLSAAWNFQRLPAPSTGETLLEYAPSCIELPSAEKRVVIQGSSEYFIAVSAGRIYCSLLPDGLGAWPYDLVSEVRFPIRRSHGGILGNLVLEGILSGTVKVEVLLEISCKDSPKDFRHLATYPSGTKNFVLELSPWVSLLTTCCLWLKATGGKNNREFLKSLCLRYVE